MEATLYLPQAGLLVAEPVLKGVYSMLVLERTGTFGKFRFACIQKRTQTRTGRAERCRRCDASDVCHSKPGLHVTDSVVPLQQVELIAPLPPVIVRKTNDQRCGHRCNFKSPTQDPLQYKPRLNTSFNQRQEPSDED